MEFSEIFEENDLLFEELMNEYSAALRQENITRLKTDLAVVTESLSERDRGILITEAEEKSQNIFQKIIASIKALISRITNAIASLFGKDNSEAVAKELSETDSNVHINFLDGDARNKAYQEYQAAIERLVEQAPNKPAEWIAEENERINNEYEAKLKAANTAKDTSLAIAGTALLGGIALFKKNPPNFVKNIFDHFKSSEEISRNTGTANANLEASKVKLERLHKVLETLEKKRLREAQRVNDDLVKLTELAKKKGVIGTVAAHFLSNKAGNANSKYADINAKYREKERGIRSEIRNEENNIRKFSKDVGRGEKILGKRQEKEDRRNARAAGNSGGATPSESNGGGFMNSRDHRGFQHNTNDKEYGQWGRKTQDHRGPQHHNI